MPDRRLPIEIQALALVDVIQFFAIVTAVLHQVLPSLPVHAYSAVGPSQAARTLYGSSITPPCSSLAPTSFITSALSCPSSTQHSYLSLAPPCLKSKHSCLSTLWTLSCPPSVPYRELVSTTTIHPSITSAIHVRFIKVIQDAADRRRAHLIRPPPVPDSTTPAKLSFLVGPFESFTHRCGLSHVTAIMSGTDSSSPMDPSASGENVPSNATPVNFDMADFLANMTADDMALLARALGAQTNPVPKGNASVGTADDGHYDLSLFTGLNLTHRSRTAAQVVNNKVRVSRNDRGKDPDQKVKTFTRWCGYSLTHKLKQPDFTKLFSSSSDDDIGTAALSSQTAFDGIVDWFCQVDAHYLLQMPDCENLFDYEQLKYCSASKDLTNIEVCRDTEFESVCQYMELINTDGSSVDVETSEWIQVKLEKSTKTVLLQQVKQSLLELPVECRGGVTLWKLIVHAIESHGFEYI